MLNSLSFCLSKNLLIFFCWIWIRAFLSRIFLVSVFPFQYFKYIMPLPLEFLFKNTLITLWGFPCMLLLFLSCFQYFLVVFNFYQFNMFLCVFFLGLSYMRLSTLPELEWVFPILWKLLSISSWNFFSGSFSLLLLGSL